MEASFEHRLKRLMLFRVVMVTTLLLIAASVEAVSETLLRVNPLYFLIALSYLLTLLHVIALRLLPFRFLQVYVQVAGDLAFITGLVYLTGSGGRAGFMLLYPLSVLSGSVLLRRWRGLILAGLATAFYAALLGAVRYGMLPPQGLDEVPFQPWKQLAYLVFVTGVACGTVAMIGSYLAHNLSIAGQQLEEVAGHLADLRELNQVIVDSIQSGLITTDSQGHVLYTNGFGTRILGRAPEALRGRSVGEIFASPALDFSTVGGRSGGPPVARLSLTYQRPDGGRLDLGLSVSPLAARKSVSRGYLLVFQDVTEVKHLEQEVRIKEKLAVVGEMAAQLAHEIRNPLGSISGSAQMLMAEPNMSQDQERVLGIITRESRRLSDILNRFLFQARPSPERPVPIDIGSIVSQAVTLLRHGPEVTPAHRVEFESEDGPHVCLADPDQIAQVFWNLARNGLESMPEGGVLEIRLGRRGDEIALSVKDQGRGIDREEQDRIFKPFHSGSRMGTGLGLAIVYQIIRDHNGDISVRSNADRGTEVEVRLPVAPPTSAADRTLAVAASRAG